MSQVPDADSVYGIRLNQKKDSSKIKKDKTTGDGQQNQPTTNAAMARLGH